MPRRHRHRMPDLAAIDHFIYLAHRRSTNDQILALIKHTLSRLFTIKERNDGDGHARQSRIRVDLTKHLVPRRLVAGFFLQFTQRRLQRRFAFVDRASRKLERGLTRAVPVIGPLLGGVPLVMVCLITTRSVQITAFLLLGFTLMHFLESKVLLPKIVGHEVDLHPVSVIIALLIGMEFFGFLGVFLAVPIAAVLKIVLAEFHETRARAALARGDTRTLQAVREATPLVEPGAESN